MKEKFAELKDKMWYKKIKEILSSDYFPFITAALIFICYYAGLDLVAAYYLVIVGIAMLLMLDDLTPVITLVIFFGAFVSMQHTPSQFFKERDPSDFYTRPYIFVQLIILIVLFFGAGAYRVAKTAKGGKFKLDPIFFGFCGLSAALILNGVFSANYNPASLGYGFMLALLFLGIYVILKDNILWNGDTLKKLSFGFTAFAVMIVIEILILYATTDGIIADGEIVRRKIGLGWGMYNNIGLYLIICSPFPFYLATRYKHGYLFYLLSFFVLGGIFLTFSRQAWGGAAFVYPACIIALLIKEKGLNKIIDIIITAVFAAIAIIMLIILREKVAAFIKKLFESVFAGENDSFSGNGRVSLWKLALTKFRTAPVFGVGFFANVSTELAPDFDGLSYIPEMYHNTFMQLLGSCGIVGLIAYLVHRVQTVICFAKKVTYERLIIGFSIVGLLILNLVDNHLFYMFPTLMYSCLIACLTASRKPATEQDAVTVGKRSDY